LPGFILPENIPMFIPPLMWYYPYYYPLLGVLPLLKT